MCCVALPCCLFDRACFFLPSFSSNPVQCMYAGVVFDRLEGDGLEYTLRLRHEVGELDTWHTEEASFWLQAPGARVTDK